MIYENVVLSENGCGNHVAPAIGQIRDVRADVFHIGRVAPNDETAALNFIFHGVDRHIFLAAANIFLVAKHFFGRAQNINAYFRRSR